MTQAKSEKLRLDASTTALVRRLLAEHVRPYLVRLVLAGLCMAITAAATAALAKLMEPILDDVFIKQDRAMLAGVAAAVLAVSAAKGLGNFGQSVLMNWVGFRIVADFQVRMFAHLMRTDLAYFHDNHASGLVSRFINDAQVLRRAVSDVFAGLGKDTLTLAFLLAVMVHQDPKLAVFAAVIFPIAVVPIIKLGKRMRRVSGGLQEATGELATFLDEAFVGVRHVKAYGMEDHETTRAKGAVARVFKFVFKATTTRAFTYPIMEVLGGAAVMGVIVYGGIQVMDGARTPGEFFSFITALLLAFEPMKRLAHLNANLQEGLAAAQRIFAMLDVAPRIVDTPDAKPLAVRAGTIAFEGVEFAYAGDRSALRGISLVVPAGKTVALVGPSGAGKSSVLNLIPRFYDPVRGRVTVDGTDVRAATLSSLRANIALVSQETHLFDDTIRANIAYGKAGAADAEVEDAARRAGAHDFIAALPEGYATRVGGRGVKLSGGQRQRIAIARAMLKAAPILLLDEATSALDANTEHQVQGALRELMRGRTTLVVAHRLSSVADADLIYVLEDGRVVESGRHGELLARGGAYARLYARQVAEDAHAAE